MERADTGGAPPVDLIAKRFEARYLEVEGKTTEALALYREIADHFASEPPDEQLLPVHLKICELTGKLGDVKGGIAHLIAATETFARAGHTKAVANLCLRLPRLDDTLKDLHLRFARVMLEAGEVRAARELLLDLANRRRTPKLRATLDGMAAWPDDEVRRQLLLFLDRVNRRSQQHVVPEAVGPAGDDGSATASVADAGDAAPAAEAPPPPPSAVPPSRTAAASPAPVPATAGPEEGRKSLSTRPSSPILRTPEVRHPAPERPTGPRRAVHGAARAEADADGPQAANKRPTFSRTRDDDVVLLTSAESDLPAVAPEPPRPQPRRTPLPPPPRPVRSRGRWVGIAAVAVVALGVGIVLGRGGSAGEGTVGTVGTVDAAGSADAAGSTDTAGSADTAGMAGAADTAGEVLALQGVEDTAVGEPVATAQLPLTSPPTAQATPPATQAPPRPAVAAPAVATTPARDTVVRPATRPPAASTTTAAGPPRTSPPPAQPARQPAPTPTPAPSSAPASGPVSRFGFAFVAVDGLEILDAVREGDGARIRVTQRLPSGDTLELSLTDLGPTSAGAGSGRVLVSARGEGAMGTTRMGQFLVNARAPIPPAELETLLARLAEVGPS